MGERTAEERRTVGTTTEEAAAKGRELREGGWPIKGLWISKELGPPLQEGGCILVLKMTRISSDQMQNLCAQIRRDRLWAVLFDFGGDEYESVYQPSAVARLSRFLEANPPSMVWEATSEWKARKAKARESSRRSNT
jgi:hypothetical protein